MIQFPGSRWWKFDFHAHSPASVDFGRGPNSAVERALTPTDWVLRFMQEGIDCVAVTDHNTGEWIDSVKAATVGLQRSGDVRFRQLVIFPGAEITANGGTHILAILAPEKTSADVAALLGAVRYHGVRGDSEVAADASPLEVVQAIYAAGGIALLAHADAARGAFALTGNTLRPLLAADGLYGVEIADSASPRPGVYSSAEGLAEVLGSDCHHSQGLPGQHYPGSHFTWVKMGIPSLEGLKLALRDAAPLSIKRSVDHPGDQNQVPENWIESIHIQSSRFMGRGTQPVTAPLNPWFNAVIGGRGTGKSSLLEFTRIAMQRSEEIPDELREPFERFRRVRENRDDPFGVILHNHGAASETTALSVVYQKSGVRFRIGWRGDGSTSLEEQRPDGIFVPAEGDVRQRFPIRIFSQKQIFALADDALALLKIIDDTPAVVRAQWDHEYRQRMARFLTVQARRRELQAGVAERPTLEGQLVDLRRKIAALENAGNAELLTEYQKRQAQSAELRSARAALENVGQAFGRAAAEISVQVSGASFNDIDEASVNGLAFVQEAESKRAEAGARLQDLQAGIQGFTNEWGDRVCASEWYEAQRRATEAYNNFIENLRAQGVEDPNQYGELVQQRQSLEQKIAGVDSAAREILLLEAESSRLLEQLRDLRARLSDSRRQFLATVLANNKHVRIELRQYQRSPRDVEREFRQLIGREDGAFAQDILSEDQRSGLIAELFRDLPAEAAEAATHIEQRLVTLKRDLLSAASGRAAGRFGGHFCRHLSRLGQETLDRILAWLPEDGLEVSYYQPSERRFHPISTGSPGQKTAAVLAFLLCHGNEPMLLDQPEDDLDNHLIYDLIVTQLRVSKARRQFVIVTHNPNIVVNGDAELVLPLDHRGGRCDFVRPPGPGCLQDREVRNEICRVMEGGRDAFQQRYRRIFLEPARN